MSTPVLTIEQMRQWEQSTWASGRTEQEVIESVGREIATVVTRLTKPAARILILAGKGHNGDDARAALPHLAGREIKLLNITNPGAQLQELTEALRQNPDLVIDALFGIGLNRPLNSDWVALIESLNTSKLPVLAVDVPSGLNANNGEPEGAAVQATRTITVGAPKIGLLSTKAGRYVGRLAITGDVGFVPWNGETEQLWINGADFANFPPRRRVDGHKGTYGHVAVIAGSAGYHGAAILSARGAAKAMPGLITVLCESAVYIPIASQLQAQMVHSWSPDSKLPEKCNSIVIGPGLASPTLGKDWKEFLNQQWRSFEGAMVVDASALAWLEPSSKLDPKFPRVITPHPGEAARMLGCNISDVQANRPRALRTLSERHGDCWVVLKGHQSLIGKSSGPIAVNSSGNPNLGQGGSGDLLAGYIGGLLAQSHLDPKTAIEYAVWQHGAAADQIQKQSWGIEDLIEALGNVPANPG